MSKFDKMNRKEKRSARLLALQLLYANEISAITINDFFKNLFDSTSSINGFSKKPELLSNFDNYVDIALSVLPDSFNKTLKITREKFESCSSEEIIKMIKTFQKKLNSYKVDIEAYALTLVKFSIKNQESLDKEIISRSQNWDSTRITLMDKLILRLVLAEIIFIEHVPPKVSIAEGIEIAKTMSTDDSSAFVNGILDSFFNDEFNKKEKSENIKN
jgi:transcription antitermination factor NusB